jgi:hypothetical protein
VKEANATGHISNCPKCDSDQVRVEVGETVRKKPVPGLAYWRVIECLACGHRSGRIEGPGHMDKQVMRDLNEAWKRSA